MHINILELKAILFAIKCFFSHAKKHIRVMCDNTTALSYVNNMGGQRSTHCHRLAKEIWEFCVSHKLWLSAAHIPGLHNVIADQCSRSFMDHTEWMIPDFLFAKIVSLWGMPTMDMFASRLNKKMTPYVSWKPDPEAQLIDCFSFSWTGHFPYLFPPFSSNIICRVLRKVREECQSAILVVPVWKAQNWFPVIMQIMKDHINIPSTHLMLPGTAEKHPMSPKLALWAVLI